MKMGTSTLTLGYGHYLGHNNRSLQSSGLVVSEIAYHTKVFEGWHSHEHAHISFLLKGGNCEQRQGREEEYTTGNIVYYHAGEMHRNTHTRHPSKNLNLEITGTFLKQYQLTETLLHKAISRQHAPFTMLKIYKELLANDTVAAPAMVMLLLELLQEGITEKSATPKWVSIIRELMQDCWDEPLTLTDLAEATGIHPITISKHFSQYFGCTFGAYMRKLRVAKSMPMIRAGENSLTEIAYTCRFADQSHFTRTFKSLTGLLPREYRNI
ncbi:helix-turn-helix transcriptional regulator [Chitinophaga rupis]|nr:AraC family transcriptional regulator [Chitinophaga rupis]